MTSKGLRTGAAMLLAVVLAVGGVHAEILEQILVKVNGEIFTKTDLETRQIATLRQMGQQFDPKNGVSDEQLRKALNEVTPKLIVDAVDEMLMTQRGRDLGYKMTEEQFQGILDNLKKENKLTSDEEFQAALKQENMTMGELRKNLERQWVVSRVQQNEVLGRVGVTEDEARKYYDSHQNEFTTTPSVTLREILVSVPKDASVAADAVAKQKALGLRTRALAGESFENLAADFSDSPSRANAGVIGPLSLAELSADLKALIDKMKAGDVSEPLRAPGGYQLLKLETVSTSQTTSFEQAREEIGNRVFTDKRKAEFDKYLTKLRTEAIIEWKNDDLKKAYQQGLLSTDTKATASQ